MRTFLDKTGHTETQGKDDMKMEAETGVSTSQGKPSIAREPIELGEGIEVILSQPLQKEPTL